MAEINLLDLYPRSKRPIEERNNLITEDHHAAARQFGKQYFDGNRLFGYGGYSYHPRFWQAAPKCGAGPAIRGAGDPEAPQAIYLHMKQYHQLKNIVIRLVTYLLLLNYVYKE